MKKGEDFLKKRKAREHSILVPQTVKKPREVSEGPHAL